MEALTHRSWPPRNMRIVLRKEPYDTSHNGADTHTHTLSGTERGWLGGGAEVAATSLHHSHTAAAAAACVTVSTTSLPRRQLSSAPHRGSVAEWLACWTQAQKGPGSYCSRDAVR